MNEDKPYSEQDYIEAKLLGYDLDDWNDYCKYYDLDIRGEVKHEKESNVRIT